MGNNRKLAVAALVLLLGCGGSTTEPEIGAQPWIGHYASMTETVEQEEGIVVLVGAQLDLFDRNECSISISMTSPDPDGDWSLVQSVDGSCRYGVAGRYAYVETYVHVVHPGGTYIIYTIYTYWAAGDWSYLTWSWAGHEIILYRS
jgi:hypothetical protein